MEEIIKSLPAEAVAPFSIALGIAVAIAMTIRTMGLRSGERAQPSAAPVAAVIVDPTALNRATDAVKNLSGEIEELRTVLVMMTLELGRRKQ